MTARSVLLLATLAAWLPAQEGPATKPDRAQLGAASELRILYAGKPGDPRETRFVGFLGQWFAKVDSIDLESLTQDAAKGYDVVVADWTRLYVDGKANLSLPKHELRDDYSKPTILIGAVGGSITRTCGSKLDWL
jgi:hypothetical protein